MKKFPDIAQLGSASALKMCAGVFVRGCSFLENFSTLTSPDVLAADNIYPGSEHAPLQGVLRVSFGNARRLREENASAMASSHHDSRSNEADGEYACPEVVVASIACSVEYRNEDRLVILASGRIGSALVCRPARGRLAFRWLKISHLRDLHIALGRVFRALVNLTLYVHSTY